MRTNKIIILIGNRNTGKTIFSKYLIKELGKKTLIVDTFNHPAYQSIERIKPSEIETLKNGIYRCFGGDVDNILKACNTFTNGFLVFEDATKYLRGSLKDFQRRFLYDSKQKNVDILLMFHSFTACPPELFRIADVLLLKKTGDSPEIRKNDCPEFENVLKAFDVVKKSDNQYITKKVLLQ